MARKLRADSLKRWLGSTPRTRASATLEGATEGFCGSRPHERGKPDCPPDPASRLHAKAKAGREARTRTEDLQQLAAALWRQDPRVRSTRRHRDRATRRALGAMRTL